MKPIKINIKLFIFFALVLPIIVPVSSAAQESVEAFTLQQTIKKAMKANLSLKISKQEIDAAEAEKKSQRTRFFPTFSATYQYNKAPVSVALQRPQKMNTRSLPLSPNPYLRASRY
jgi:outer membrane protein TolC